MFKGFAKDRAIAPDLMATATDIVENTRAHETYEVLDWAEPSVNYQTRKPHDFGSLLVFKNEDGSTFQAKPERSRTDEKGKVIKYETPKGNGSRAYLPAVDKVTRQKISEVQGVDVPSEGSFWDWVAANPQLTKVFTEGPGKTLALLSAGYIAIGLMGCNGGYRSKATIAGEKIPLDRPELIDDLKRFASGPIVLAFDKDAEPTTIKRVRAATCEFGAILEKSGCDVRVLNWNPARGKGIDDVLAGLGDAGGEWLAGVVEEAPPLIEYGESWRHPVTLDESKALLLQGLKSGADSSAIESASTIDGLIDAINGANFTNGRWRSPFMDLAGTHFNGVQLAGLATAFQLDKESIMAIGNGALRKLRDHAAANHLDIADVLSDCYGAAIWKAVNKADTQFVDYVKLCHKFGDRLRYNSLRMACELDGHPIDLDQVRGEFVNRFAFDPKSKSENMFLKTVVQVCKRNSYSPVVDYLNMVAKTHGADTSILNGFASRYFGNDSAIAQTFIVKTLIAAVARAKNPGCKVDTVLVLQGDQGLQKSSFFDVLSRNWFDDSMGDSGNKDEILKAQSAWFVEWGELNHITGKKGIEKTKAFLASRVDRIRLPYGRVTVEMPRSFMITGSSNPKEILHDDTGNRRFWPLEVFKSIDVALLESEVDRIWAAAVALYESRAQWWLTAEETALANLNNEEFKSEDVWLAPIESWVSNPMNWDYRAGSDAPYIRVNRVLEDCLKIEIGRQGTTEKNRVTKCLRQLGWQSVKNPVRLDGQAGQARVWQRIADPTEEVIQPEPLATAEPNHTAPKPGNLPTGEWVVPATPKPTWRPTHKLTDGTEVAIEKRFGPGKTMAAVRDGTGLAKTVNGSDLTPIADRSEVAA
jgi:predicted P-loop ATPase